MFLSFYRSIYLREWGGGGGEEQKEGEILKQSLPGAQSRIPGSIPRPQDHNLS